MEAISSSGKVSRKTNCSGLRLYDSIKLLKNCLIFVEAEPNNVSLISSSRKKLIAFILANKNSPHLCVSVAKIIAEDLNIEEITLLDDDIKLLLHADNSKFWTTTLKENRHLFWQQLQKTNFVVYPYNKELKPYNLYIHNFENHEASDAAMIIFIMKAEINNNIYNVARLFEALSSIMAITSKIQTYKQ